MVINKVTRTYSRSINTKTYGGAESWIKVEATYEGQCESGDDPIKVSEMLHAQAQKDVIANVAVIVDKVKQAANPAPAAGTSVATPPLTPTAPRQL